MDCTVCREPMITMELDSVEIDHCLDCKGIWLDSGELEILLEGTAAQEELLASFQKEERTKEALRKCPICLKKMNKVLCGFEKQVLIDRCRRNHGLWFDYGELEEIISIGSLGKDMRVLDLLKDMFGKK